MSSNLGPSHHLYFGAIHRRKLWLGHLTQAFESFAGPTWPVGKAMLDKKFSRTLARFPATRETGIGASLPLRETMDDTPIDSFLTGLAEELESYEQEFFLLIEKTAVSTAWVDEFEQTSALWGRNLAQECLTKPTHGRILWSPRSLRGVLEVFQSVLLGGDFVWKGFLLRRYTDQELQYELRSCPHQKKAASSLSCQLESKIFEGFVQTLLPDASYQRRNIASAGTSYCVDQLNLR